MAVALLAFLTILFIPLLFKLLLQKKKNLRTPPGNLGWPIVGETLAYASSINSPRPLFFEDRVARYGSVFKTSLFGSKTVVLPAPDGNRLVLMSENKLVTVSYPKSVSILLGPSSLISLRGEDHRRSKGLLMNFLRPDMLQRFVGRECTVIQDHLHKFWIRGAGEEDQVLCVYPLMKRFTFALACNLLVGLGVDDGEMESLAHDFDVLVRGLFQLPINVPGTAFRRAKAARRNLDRCFDRHIRERKQELTRDPVKMAKKMEHQDMIQVLLTTRDEDGRIISDSAIRDNIVSLLFAGHDTSSVALTWTFKFLADYPSCMERVFQENLEVRRSLESSSSQISWEDLRKLKYTWLVVQEAMRMRPPVGGGFREALTEIEFEGYIIPKGWKLLWNTYMSYRKPEFFVEPNKFDPSRFSGEEKLTPYTYLPFGAGARMCPGNEFAKMEILLFLHYSVLLFEWKLLEPQEGVIADPMARPVHGLPISISSRKK